MTNALDHALCAELYATGYHPLIAGDDELCTRLFVDMIGVRPSAERIANECAGKPTESVIAALQKTVDYRKQQRRSWADRFSYSDAVVDALSIRDLDRLVDDLYQERISYKDFAIQALAHPGFVGRFNSYGLPELTAQAAFKAFLGRPATRPEAIDLGALWRPWATGYGPIVEDGDVAYGYASTPQIDPNACAAGKNSCSSTLLGAISVEFPTNGRTDYIRMEDLTPDQWDALRAPGKIFAQHDALWEAQVDETMMRFLGYDLGALRPRARQAVVDFFRQDDGNVVALEKMILSSWAYRQTAKEMADKPRPEALKAMPFAYGPTKLMLAETWLHSVAQAIGRDIGECDWRYPNLPDYNVTPEAREVLGDFYTNDTSGNIDPSFRNLAHSVGGCPGMFDPGSFSVSLRSRHIGLITAVAQEEALVNVCFLNDVPALMPPGMDLTDRSDAALRLTARHVLENTVGKASEADVQEAVDLFTTNCPACDVEGVARGLCSGLFGGIEFMTY